MERKKFFQKWGDFLGVVFSPGAILPLLLATGSLFLSTKVSDDTLLSGVLSFISMVLAGIAGFSVTRDWDKLRGDSLLIKKGQSAIRNLTSIAQQAELIRAWIQDFILKKSAKRDLEEVYRHLGTMTFNIKSGLEDWTDIVPELSKTEEVAKTYKDVIEAHLEEILKKRKELLGAGGDEKRKKQLERRIKELEKKVKGLGEERREVFGDGSGYVGMGSAPTPSISPSTSPTLFTDVLSKVCSRCHRAYSEEGALGISLGSVGDLCPKCEAASEG